MAEPQYPIVSAVRAQARLDWEQKERWRIGIQERIGQSVPWWLVLIALVFFALSAPHTAATFDKLTPGWGWVAPAGVEFGLLFAAFQRKKSNTGKWSWFLFILELLLFLTAIVVNAAGAFTSVVEATKLANLPFSQIWDGFGTLPATNQVALILVPLSALIIPIGTSVAGEGVAALILEREEHGSLLDVHWQKVAQQVEFAALRDAAIDAGISPIKAAKWASQIAGQQVRSGEGHSDGKSDASSTNGSQDKQDKKVQNGTGRQWDELKAGQAYKLIVENPHYLNMPVRILEERTGINKNAWGPAKDVYRNNGHNVEVNK